MSTCIMIIDMQFIIVMYNMQQCINACQRMMVYCNNENAA